MNWLEFWSSVDWSGISVVAIPIISLLVPLVSTIISQCHDRRMWELQHVVQRKDEIVKNFMRAVGTVVEMPTAENKAEYRAAFSELLAIAPQSAKESILNLDKALRTMDRVGSDDDSVEYVSDLLATIASRLSHKQ